MSRVFHVNSGDLIKRSENVVEIAICEQRERCVAIVTSIRVSERDATKPMRTLHMTEIQIGELLCRSYRLKR